ncbi:MAG: hypothetical protein PHH08_00510 [Candidatus ainarchaeum sp.]|nr:hypothetical protein [Candidatus ainarchaeum sp.]
MARSSNIFKLGAGQYQVDFDSNKIIFYYVSRNKGHRAIGTASFRIVKGAALFNGGITHRSPRVVKELMEVAEGIFREAHPGVSIGGHALWLHQKKPPAGVSLGAERPQLPKRRPQPRRR